MTLQESHEQFCKQLVYLKGCSPKTIRSYRQSFTSFQSSRGGPNGNRTHVPDSTSQCPIPLDDGSLTKAQLENWVIWMRSRGMSPGGANVYIRGMNSFISWLRTEQQSSLTKLPLLKSSTGSLETFSDSDIRLILSFRPSTFTQWRLWTLIQCVLDTGCRIDEILSMPEHEIDMENCLLSVKGKGDKHRRVPFSLECRKVLFRYAQIKSKRVLRDDGYFFCAHSGSKLMYRNVYRDIRNFCRSLGISGPRISPHTFRHTFASNFIRQGGNPFHLQRILGHNHISTTMKYVHLQSEDLSKAHAQFGILSRLR